MTKISVDHQAVARLLAEQGDASDAIERALDKMPGQVDGGVASAMIGLLVAAAAESTAVVVDAQRVLEAVTVGALAEFGRTENQIQGDIDRLSGIVEER